MTNATDVIRGFLASLKRLSTAWIVIGNLIPLLCVIAFGWPAGVLLLLYWSENVIVGGVNALKMTACGLNLGIGGVLILLFLIPFFTFHYGMFCFVHGVFVMAIGSMGDGGLPGGVGGSHFSPFGLLGVVRGLVRTEPGFGWSLAAIAGMQLFSLVFDWLARGRFREVTPMEQMAAPYGRIIVLHIALLGGGFLVAALGSPVGALVVLVIMKTLLDLGLVAVGENSRAETKPSPKLAEQRRKLAELLRSVGQRRS